MSLLQISFSVTAAIRIFRIKENYLEMAYFMGSNLHSSQHPEMVKVCHGNIAELF